MAEELQHLIERIRKEGVFRGIEGLLPLVYQKLDTLFDYVPANSLWIQSDFRSIEKSAVYAQDQAVKMPFLELVQCWIQLMREEDSRYQGYHSIPYYMVRRSGESFQEENY